MLITPHTAKFYNIKLTQYLGKRFENLTLWIDKQSLEKIHGCLGVVLQTSVCLSFTIKSLKYVIIK